MALTNTPAGHLTLADDTDAHVVWSTARPSVQLMRDAAISLTGQTVTFPDYSHGHAYYYWHINADPPFLPFPQDVCDSFVTLLPGEYGPGLTNNLSRTLLGVVPIGTDYLDVRVKVERTTDPTAVLGGTIQVIPQENAWINCPGGSCPLEFHNIHSRHFNVVMIDDDTGDDEIEVYLERYQSIRDAGDQGFWRVGNGSGLAQDGWSHAGGSGAKGWIVYHIDAKSAGAAVTKYKTGGSNSCSLSDPTNYGAVYAADFEITPGRYSH